MLLMHSVHFLSVVPAVLTKGANLAASDLQWHKSSLLEEEKGRERFYSLSFSKSSSELPITFYSAWYFIMYKVSLQSYI